VVIETLRAQYGVRRIAYADIDAHHGDGVYDAYQEDAGGKTSSLAPLWPAADHHRMTSNESTAICGTGH
jgi:acetoin utilization deacetylase AcuC-like enzyme